MSYAQIENSQQKRRDEIEEMVDFQVELVTGERLTASTTISAPDDKDVWKIDIALVADAETTVATTTLEIDLWCLDQQGRWNDEIARLRGEVSTFAAKH